MKLFVAKLNRDVQDEHLEEAFSAFGPVAYTRVITDRDTGQSKCFGFVQMREAADGQKALEEMNGAELMGFRMVVKEAEDRAKKANGFALQRTAVPRADAWPIPRRIRQLRLPRHEPDHHRNTAGWILLQSPRKQGAAKAKPTKAGKFKGNKDIYADGPKPTKLKKSKTKRTDWLEDLDDF